MPLPTEDNLLVMKKTSNKNDKDAGRLLIPVLSFFTGGGFLDIGFAKVGFKVVWTNENNKAFADMYAHGMTALAKSLGDDSITLKISDTRSIKNISNKYIMRVAFPNGRPAIFGIIGGPPCPDFSNGGKHRGHQGDHGRLSRIFVNRICLIKPAFFVFENVPGLVQKTKHRLFLESLEKKLEGSGYCIDRATLNSLDMGLAQDRGRVFLIGIRNKIAEICVGKRINSGERGWFPWPERKKYKGAKSKFRWPLTVEGGGTPRKPKLIPEELMVNYLLSNIPESMPNAKEGFKPYSRKFQTVLEGDTSRKSFKRLHRYRYSPTACYGNNEVHLHPWEDRRLTVREATRIQGIPDAYELPSQATLSAKFKMIANGVPVPLALYVAKKLYALLEPVVSDNRR